MSIDALVQKVVVYPNGSGHLELVDRPSKRAGDNPGVVGQRTLYFEGSPPDIRCLTGQSIWGNSSFIMLGDIEIAKRKSYTQIEFLDTPQLWGIALMGS